MKRPELREELLERVRRDAEVRAELAASGELFAGYASAMERVHLDNAAWLERVLDDAGWPGRSQVGEDGAEAAWLLVQHAISRPAFQRRCLELLRRAAAEDEVTPAQLACLTDRIRFNERRPQLFGTVFDWDEEGRMSPWTVEDPEKLAERRAAAGLPPLEETVAAVRRQAVAESERPPSSYEARQRELRAWARKTGWID